MATPSPSPSIPDPIDSILIIGAGVFGLSTTLSLLTAPAYANTKITLLDPYLPDTLEDDTASPSLNPPSQNQNQNQIHLQNPHAASIDSSRIIRPDYASPPYAKLAAQAQQAWRSGYGGGGGEGVYRENGIILSAEKGGSAYVERAYRNARGLGYRVQSLRDKEEVGRALGTGGEGGESGYVNFGGGWADAGRAMGVALGMVVERGRGRNREGMGKGKVVLRRGKAGRLIFTSGGGDDGGRRGERRRRRRRVLGAMLEDGSEIRAQLTVVAAGAWSGALVDLRGRAEARGQVLSYIPITYEEKESLKNMPVILNLSTSMFAIPPNENNAASSLPATRARERRTTTGGWVLKVARHGFGYANPTTVAPEGEDIVVSLPARTFSPIPVEGEQACRAFLQKTIPWLGDRPFSGTRICWYTDTPSGNFLIDYHPGYEGLFLATAGSGHGFKFLPLLGDKIVAAMEGRLEEELAGLWRWPGEGVLPFRGCEDGSRMGDRDMVLEEEWAKGERVRSML